MKLMLPETDVLYKTETVFDTSFEITSSTLPSPVTSPIAIPRGPVPELKSWPVEKVMLPETALDKLRNTDILVPALE